MINYDLKCAGESTSMPHVRLPPLRGNGEHLKQLLRVAIDSGDETGSEIGSHDLYVLFTAGKPGLKAGLMSGFAGMDGTVLEKNVRTLTVHYDEESYMSSRVEKTRGFNHNLVEEVHCVTKKAFDVAATG
jgi:hypothetical protein